MTIQLLKNGVPVLTAKSGHQRGASGTSLPVTYEGDMALFDHEPWDDASASMVESIMWRAAHQHGLEVAGDYKEIIPQYGPVKF